MLYRKVRCSKTLVFEHNSFQKHACNPKHLYIKAFFLLGINEKRGTSKCSNKLLHVVPSLNVTILLHLGAPLFFILSCDMTLLLYQDIACISRQNVLKHFACLAKRSQTKLLSNQGFTVHISFLQTSNGTDEKALELALTQ